MKIFITGVSSGLGRELAKQLLDKEYEVWGVSRTSREKLDQNLLDNKNFYYSVCDVLNHNQILETVQKMENANFIPDKVILNAASLKGDSLNGLSNQSFEDVFNPNFFGVSNWLKVFAPIFKKRNKGAFIVISSFSAYFPIIRGEVKFAYPTSKAAVNMLFDSLRWGFRETDLEFTIFNFGRMEEIKQGFLCSSYKEAVGRIMAHLGASEDSRTIFYPLLNYLILRTISLVPYKWLKKIIG